MEISRTKNILAVIAIILLTAFLITAVVYTAVESNKTMPEWELYIDTSPIDYSTDESYLHVKRFKDIFTAKLNTVMGGGDASVLADRLLNALSVARIPSEKVGTMATAINGIDGIAVNNFLEDFENITEDDLNNIVKKSTVEYTAELISTFFDKSKLTEEEFSRFLYTYLELYAQETYKTYLKILGKDYFTKFFSNTIYLINMAQNISENESFDVSNYALQAVAYQLGSVYAKIVNDVGYDVLEKVLCLDWQYNDASGNPLSEANEVASGLKGKTVLVFGLLGQILQNSEINYIATLRASSSIPTDDKKTSSVYVYSKYLTAKAISDGIDCMFSAKTGIADYSSFKILFAETMTETVKLYSMLNGIDPNDEDLIEQINLIKEETNIYFAGIEYFDSLDLTLERIENASSYEFANYIENIEKMSALSYGGDLYFTAFVYNWTYYQTNVLQETLGGQE